MKPTESKIELEAENMELYTERIYIYLEEEI